MSSSTRRPRLLRALLTILATSLVAAPSALGAEQWGKLSQIGGSPGTAPGELTNPSALDSRLNGGALEVYAADQIPAGDDPITGEALFELRVQRFASDGSLLGKVVSQLTDSFSEFPVPFANIRLAVDPAPAVRDRLIVAGSDSQQLTAGMRSFPATSAGAGTAFAAQEFTGSGRLESPTDVAIAPDGKVYVAGLTTAGVPQVRALTSAGAAHQVSGTPVRFGGDATLFDSDTIIAVAVAPSGDVWVLDRATKPGTAEGQKARLRRYTADGVANFPDAAAWRCDHDNSGATADLPCGQFLSDDATDIAFGSVGGTYVNTPSGLAEYQATGERVRVWGGDAAFSNCKFADRPVAIAASGDRIVGLDASLAVARAYIFGPGGSGCGFENQLPTASIASDPFSPLKGQQVTFTATASDPDATGAPNLTYEWSLDGDTSYEIGPGSTTVVNKTFDSGGPRTVRLRVTDGDGGQREVSATIQVGSALPTASLRVSPAAPVAGQPVTFDGSGSSDTDGTIANYEWDLDGDGIFEVSGPAPTTSRTYTAAGTFNARLRVTDSDGTKGTVTRSLTVTAAPVATPSGPPPSAPSVPAPAAGIPATKISADAKGVVKIPLTCPAGATACEGTLVLQTAKAVAAAKKKRVIVLGKASVRVSAGGKAVVTVRLSSAGRKLLSKSKRLAAKVIVTTRAGASSTASSKLVTITVAKKKR